MRIRFQTLFAILILFSFTEPALAQGNWADKVVILKKPGVKISDVDPKNSKDRKAELQGISYVVIEERDGLLKIREKGVEAWLDKAHVVGMNDAIAYFTDRIQANEKDAQAFAFRAVAWQLKREFDIALKDANEALRLEPKVGLWWYSRGNVWSGKGDTVKAIQDFDEAIRLDPKNALFYNTRGIVRSYQDNDKAMRDFDEAVRLDAKFASA
jgi:tetratricopeptide (TPR) repeat protein